MKSIQKYLILSLMLAVISCMPNGDKSTQNPSGKPNMSGEKQKIYPVTAQNQQLLESKLQQLYNFIDRLNETLMDPQLSKDEQDEIIRQRNVLLNLIAITNNMYIGNIKVDIKKINRKFQEVIHG